MSNIIISLKKGNQTLTEKVEALQIRIVVQSHKLQVNLELELKRIQMKRRVKF